MTTDHALYCWGSNREGELGIAAGDSLSHPVPVRVDLPGSYTAVVVSGPALGACAKASDGHVACWGNSNPAQSQGSVSAFQTASQVALGSNSYLCFVGPDQRVSCAGAQNRPSGRLGNNSMDVDATLQPAQPVAGGKTAAAVALGGEHACALGTGGSAFCWGAGDSGQLGTAATLQTCAEHTGANHGEILFFACSSTPVPVESSVQFTTLSAGGSTTCGRSTAGDGYCWGSGYASIPRLLLPGTKLRSISVAPTSRVCAVTSLGEIFCTGTNQYGQGGDDNTSSTIIHRLRSELVFTDVRAATTFTCGLTATGAAYCWGDNGAGELGARSLPSVCTAGGSYPCTSQPVRVGSQD